MRRRTLHKVKVVIASYLLQLQFDTGDGSVGKLQEDQRTAQECYLVSIRPLMESLFERRPAGPPPSDKRQQTMVPPPTEALVICILTSADPGRLHPEALDGIEDIPLDEGHPDRTVRLGREIEAAIRCSFINIL